jgi:FtsP/CotA-like multicopper oxidase with cupredoxin domain
VALAVAIVAGITVFHPGPNHRPVVARDPIDVGGLPTLTSRNGLLEATLSAGPLAVQIGEVNFAGAGYNGSYGGPVLRVRPGDRVVLHLDNHMADAINLHFHGLRITPLGHGDNMHVLVAPGTSYDYDFRIPANHPPGLFWYHDHAHGAAEPHVMAGLSGALLIEGFAGQFKGLADVPQKLLVLKDWKQPDCTGAVLKTALHCRVVSINGSGAWDDALAPGDTQLWRVSNQGANLILHLVAPGLRMRVVGRDGMPATDGQDGPGFDVMPASRVDVLVHADAAGDFPLMAVGVPTKTAAGFSVKRTLGVVTVAGAAKATPAPSLAFPHQQDMRAWKIDARRTIVFSEKIETLEYYVNGKKFDPLRTDVRAPLGNVEEWTIQNVTDDFHEFHIHQLSFQVTEINGTKQTFSGYVDDAKVPEHGEIKVIIPFTDPTIVGHIMYHCHVLNHEDRGMMTMMEVYRPSVPHICNVPAR